MRDDNRSEIIVIIVSIIIFAFVFFLTYTLSAKHVDKLWNDGHCNICGGSWKYEQAVGHRSTTSYIYVCEKCGKRIEISEIR